MSDFLKNTPVPALLIVAGIVGAFLAAAGRAIKGFGVDFEIIESPVNRLMLGLVSIGLLVLGLWVGNYFPGHSGGSEPKSSSVAQPSRPPASSTSAAATTIETGETALSPEETVSTYLRAVSTRDLGSAKHLMPSMDIEATRDWLEGRGSKSPIRSASLVSAEQIKGGASRVTIRGQVRFCRMDGSGTDEQKDYELALNRGTWEIRISYEPAKVTSIRC